MGMAASQARFLGLTARKSNVEYQGQQVNQERTALANDSANLYNQMMKLDVPTPPSANEYYKTSYVLEGSNSDGDYSFTTATRTYNGEKEYSIVLSRDVVTRSYKPATFSLSTAEATSKKVNDKDVQVWTFGSNTSKALTFIPELTSPYDQKDDKGQEKIDTYRLYQADANVTDADVCLTKEGLDPSKYYFYQDAKGKNHFVSHDEVKQWQNEKKSSDKNLISSYEYSKPQTTTVTGTIEKSDSGRFTSIEINKDERYGSLSGQTFNIQIVTEKDEEGYKDAYSDYEYEKDVYDQTMEKINAQTQIIQSEDKQLELRLRELETEQNAISTEMDSVKKVIEDNVEKTFNIFG